MNNNQYNQMTFDYLLIFMPLPSSLTTGGLEELFRTTYHNFKIIECSALVPLMFTNMYFYASVCWSVGRLVGRFWHNFQKSSNVFIKHYFPSLSIFLLAGSCQFYTLLTCGVFLGGAHWALENREVILKFQTWKIQKLAEHYLVWWLGKGWKLN